MVDAAAVAGGRQARAILIEAVQRRLVRLDDLEQSGSDLALAGITVIGVTRAARAADPRRQLVRIERAHREAARDDRRPAVTALRRPALPGIPGAGC
ncbi:hypothetical protein N865_11770 [Intrasporangium oryzae NRRL B-24470]|uniref:Uncharacterized protein n=1 Tax=Intrasporangium oryzae NRRL B-24470 TaxID=1386089 RepID=W9GB72_9MICO|nr:hypothetical protein [Intrasporangium oryzae]EWT01099.1 hypothetical protein N865_11770 [Intrasporangium oryzae NRRL B-24470]